MGCVDTNSSQIKQTVSNLLTLSNHKLSVCSKTKPTLSVEEMMTCPLKHSAPIRIEHIAPLPFQQPVKPSLVLQWFSVMVNTLYGTSYGST